MKKILAPLGALLGVVVCMLSDGVAAAADLRIGMIGLDTSHATAFSKILHDAQAKDHVPGGRVVAAVKGGSRDIESSWSRVEEYTKELREKWGVTIYETIEEMCRHVDVVLVESVDGRPHLEQARPVIAAGKPLYIDKPMAASLKDAAEIFRLARAANVPVFSASSLRFGKATQAVRQGSIGRVLSAETFSPCHLDPTHPDLFWYGIHGVESLFTLMGPGCVSVRRGKTAEGKIEVTGTWDGGRTGIYREREGYGGLARGEKGESAAGAFDGYGPLIVEVVKFFQTRVPPVSARETLEILAFMEAADESKKRDGAAVTLQEMFDRVGVRAEDLR